MRKYSLQYINYSTIKSTAMQIYNNKCMIVSTQATNTKIFAFIAVLVFKLFNCKILFINRKENKKIANFTDKLLQNYKSLECEFFRILLKHVSDHLLMLF